MSFDYSVFQKANLGRDLRDIDPHLSYLWYEVCGKKNLKEEIRNVWGKGLAVSPDPWRESYVEFSRLPDNFGFVPEADAVSYLPNFSFMLEIPFKLSKPFHSRDERDFYLLDNPLRREKVFKTPMIAAAGWKGALRAAMVRQLAEWWESLGEEGKKDRSNRKDFVVRRCRLARLFGTEHGVRPGDDCCETYLDKLGGDYPKNCFHRLIRLFAAKNGFFAGNLHFFPTFFEEVKLEVLNPHDRKTGISKRGPLFFECVPQGAKGRLVLLYVPSALTGRSDVKKRKAAARDLKLLAEGIAGMLTVYGFGAKTGGGFGTAEEDREGGGKIVIKMPGQSPPFTSDTSGNFRLQAEQAADFLMKGGKA